MQRQVARWLIDHDPAETRRRYGQLPPGIGCACDQCRNFDTAAGQTFPAAFVRLLDDLGVDPAKPVELCHYSREPSGLYFTGGWFHLVGAIIDGEDGFREVDGSGTCISRFEELVPGLEFGFTNRLALVHDAFAGLPLVQLEFHTRVPWILAESEPDELT